jgi:hypothetical protein
MGEIRARRVTGRWQTRRMLKGTLLAEGLRIGAALGVAGLRVTRLTRRDVSASASAAQPSVWTFLDFEADDDLADPLAQSLADTLLADGGWYADFTVVDDHMVVFAGKIFRYRRGDQSGRATAADYGRTVGVPDHQLDWTD